MNPPSRPVPDNMPTMIGRVVGQYRITARLGEGGMGVVYRATDVSLRREVALKFIRGPAAAGSDARVRFMAEARAAAALNHPSICTVYQVLEAEADDGSVERVPVLAMELVPGETLATQLEQRGPFAIDAAMRIAIDVADGLAEAHGRGVIHRDLKPQNVMTAGSRLKILDFGLSKPVQIDAHSDETTRGAVAWTVPQELPGQVLGTVAYMAPEQALGRSTDARADVFSFGVTLYELVTGKRPFQGADGAETLARVIAAEVVPASSVRAEVPPALDRIIQRCLRKDPADRYQTAADLAEDLRRAQAQPGDASAIGRSAAAAPRGRRWRHLWLAAAAIGLAGAATLSLWPDRGSTGPASPVEYAQVTFVNDASYPAVSRDGSLMAYVRGEPWGELFQTVAVRAPQKIVIHDMVSSQVIEVTECRPCLGLQWSSDGSSLFALTERGVIQLSRLGGRLREFPADRVPLLAVAPDGSAFATARQAPGTLQVTDAQTGAIVPIPFTGDHTSIQAVDWAPSGDRLAVLVGDVGRRHIWTVSRDGAVQTVVAEDVGRVNTLKWSPAGGAIYYLKVSGLSRDLWEVPVHPQTGAASGPATVVLSGLQGGPHFSISADGKTLAYTRETRFANLWTVSIGSDASDEPVQLTTGTRVDQYPAISPDGRTIAFLRSDGHAADVHVMPRGGGAAARVTFLEGVYGAPAWSPDGARLAFCANQNDSRHVWTIPAAGGPASPLNATTCTTLESEVPVSWAPGQDILYQREGNRNYHRIDAVTGRETPLVADPARGWVFAPRRHGDLVAVLWNERTRRGAWLFDLADGAERFLADNIWPAAWSPDGSTIVGYEDRESNIVSISVRDGRVRVLRSMQGRRIALVPAVAPDLRSIVYSAHSILADVWAVRNFRAK